MNENDVPAGVSRRDFLRDVAALTAAGSVLASCARGAGAAAGATSSGAASASGAGTGRGSAVALKPSVNGIGLQLYTVADQLRSDFEGTIEKVALVGYKQVEFAGYANKTAEQVRAVLDRLRLKSPSTHIAMDALRKDLGAQIAIAQTVGHEYITIPSLGRSETPMTTVDAWKRVADECNTIGAKLRSNGLGLAFHSHSAEFAEVGDGKTGMDVFISETDPSALAFEIDLGWARVAGQDPVAWFRKYPNRFPMWHIKDFENLKAAQDRAAGRAPASSRAGRPSPVGSGDIDFRPILAEWKLSGMRYFFVEQDGAAGWPGGSLESIATSYQNLRKLLP